MIFDPKTVLGLIAVFLAFICYVPYYAGIFRGTIKPHIFTYGIWVILGIVVFLASWISGGAAGTWSLAVSTILVLGVFLLAFKYGTPDITRFDVVCTVGAVAAIAAWIYTKDPMIAVILATIIEILSFLPTFRKTWSDPTSESALSWSINSVRHAVTIMALGSYSITTVLYPAALVILNALLVLEIKYRTSVNQSGSIG